jgi:hypothetical protein
VRLEGLGKLKKIRSPHRAWNPRPSGLQQSASAIALEVHITSNLFFDTEDVRY